MMKDIDIIMNGDSKYVIWYSPSYVALNTIGKGDDYETMCASVIDAVRKYRRGLYSECPRVFERDGQAYKELDIRTIL